jgi:hypothetical protein
VAMALRGLDPEVRERAELVLAWARHWSIPVNVTSGYRSFAEQTRLRRNFDRCVAERKFPGPGCRFPANRPGDSAHNFGLAFDSTVAPALQPWWTAIRIWAGFNVPSNDIIHAEVPSWRNFADPRSSR